MSNLSTKMDEIIKVLEKEIPNASEIAINTMLGAYSYRIFNIGNATDGKKIGNYKLGPYKRLREKGGMRNGRKLPGGRQTGYVDLDFTSALRFSIVVGEVGEQKVMGFNSLDQAKIAGFQKERYKKDIFTPSEEEIEIAKEAFMDYLKEKIQLIFDTW